ncbi:2-hydroxyacid dehydrogenase [Salibacterium aidingense]|uniref:2-hydroxyacid dehydrogenase n=1 Tax=Salibacterium aidingense TaxID=384933 RepID=UPI003BC48DAC
MKKQKIIAYKRVSPEVVKKLREDYDVAEFTGRESLSDPAFLQELGEAAGVIGVEWKGTEEVLKHAPNLRVVSNISVGYDNLDLPALSRRGILATNTPHVLTDTTADAVFVILMAAARRVCELDQYVKNGEWQTVLPADKFGVDVHHKTLGIIGMGRIGEAIAKRGHYGFDMNIHYHNRSRKPEVEHKYKAWYCGMDELLETSDFICLMTPLTSDTHHLIGKTAFKKMKSSAVFVNGSRGKTVDEKALIEALQTNEIRAAGLDVFAEEPMPADNPLLSLPNAVTLPHIGAATYENEHRMASLAAKNLKDALSGRKPDHLLNPEAFNQEEA